MLLQIPIAADCGNLINPANGNVALTLTTYDSTADYSCSDSNVLVGDAVRTCQADGMWDGTAPTCGKLYLQQSTINSVHTLKAIQALLEFLNTMLLLGKL